jgi:hypothetical protein
MRALDTPGSGHGRASEIASAGAPLAGLPPPVARFRDLAKTDVPIETVVIEASAVMRRPRIPPIPLEIRIAHRLGREFVHQIRIGRGWLSFAFGLDAYVDGRGLMKIGPSIQAGAHFDQGALIALWGEALGFPSAWECRNDVRWEEIDDVTARLVVPGPEGEIAIMVGFDRVTGFPATCEADRYKSTGPKVHWIGRLSDWRRTEGGVLAPCRFTAQWADEPSPWIDIRTKGIVANSSVDDLLRVGREALRAVARRGQQDAAELRPGDVSKGD